MGWERYKSAVKREGWSWYESEVPTLTVCEVMGAPHGSSGRSYEMPVEEYREWLNFTGMDMVYGYVPWHWGRDNGYDEWGRFYWKKALLDVGDLIGRPPYDELRKSLDELSEIKGDRGLEWALYNTSNVVIDGLGLEKFCVEMMDRPGKLKGWMDRIDERVAKELEVILEWPVEVVQISQPLCDKNGPMFGPNELWEFNLKYFKRRADRIHEECRLVSLHCDGNNRKIFSRLGQVDVFNGYDGDDYERDYKETKWGWRGAVPTNLLQTGTPDDIKNYVRGMNPQVIGSEDLWELPTANWVALMEAARELQSRG